MAGRFGLKLNNSTNVYYRSIYYGVTKFNCVKRQCHVICLKPPLKHKQKTLYGPLFSFDDD